MATVFTVVNPLENQDKSGPATVEGREFKHAVIWMPGGADIQQTFSLSGNVPSGLSINPTTGEISGLIDHLEIQGITGSGIKYPEYDFREMEEYHIRQEESVHTFDFKIISTGTEQVGPQTVPFTVSEDLTIKIIKDSGVEAALMMKAYLDGVGSRAGYTCNSVSPRTKEQCDLIGGVWENGACSISLPNQQKCEEAGGVWEDGKCNVMMIQTQEKCEALGYNWVKNGLTRQDVIKQECKNFTITDEQSCQLYDGTWVTPTDPNMAPYCQNALVEDQRACELFGGTWEEELSEPSGRNTFQDYKKSIKDKKTLQIINKLE